MSLPTKAPIRGSVSTLQDLVHAYKGTGLFAIDGEYPIERFGPNGMEVRVMAHSNNWDNRLDIVKLILGGLHVDGSVTLPISYSSAFPELRATSVEINPEGQRPVAGTASPDVPDTTDPVACRFLILFEVVPWQQWDTGEIAAEHFDQTTEFITVPPKGLSWDAAGEEKLSNNESIGITTYDGVWTVTFYFVNELPSYNPLIYILTNNTNHTNQQTHYSPRYQMIWPAETLLMGPPTGEFSLSPWGVRQWQITVPLAYKASGWNRFRRSGYSDPVDIYKDGSLYKPYPPQDWTAGLGGWIPVPP